MHSSLIFHPSIFIFIYLGVPLTGRAFGTNTALGPHTSNMRCKCASIPHASLLEVAAGYCEIIAT